MGSSKDSLSWEGTYEISVDLIQFYSTQKNVVFLWFIFFVSSGPDQIGLTQNLRPQGC